MPALSGSLVALLLVLLLAAPARALNATIIDGVVTAPGTPPYSIANRSSAIAAALSSIFNSSAAPGGDPQLILKNSSSFYDYLVITGSYHADATIALTPGLALVLADATLAATAPALAGGGPLILAQRAPWSAVLGRGVARLACAPGGGASAPYALHAAQSPGFVLDGVAISDCDCVHLEGVPFVTGGEVANCVITNARGRAVWTEKIARAVIHGNTVVNASAHTLDFDAFSTLGLCYNNTVSQSRQEAVFIEQGATYITVVDNDLGPGNGNGVGVYNNDIGAETAGHVIVRNRIFGNSRGVSVGSTAQHSGALAASVLVAGNALWDNAGQGLHTNGAQVGTLYVANDDADGASLYTLAAGSAANISFADPQDRVKVASQ